MPSDLEALDIDAAEGYTPYYIRTKITGGARSEVLNHVPSVRCFLTISVTAW